MFKGAPYGETRYDPEDGAVHDELCIINKIYLLSDVANLIDANRRRNISTFIIVGANERHKGVLSDLHVLPGEVWPDGGSVVLKMKKTAGLNGKLTISAGYSGRFDCPYCVTDVVYGIYTVPSCQDLVDDIPAIAKAWVKEAKMKE